MVSFDWLTKQDEAKKVTIESDTGYKASADTISPAVVWADAESELLNSKAS